MKTVRWLIVLLAIGSSLVGCGPRSTPTPTIEPTSTPTVVELFEAELHDAADSAHIVPRQGLNPASAYEKFCTPQGNVQISYDVQQTDSLVSPYLGTGSLSWAGDNAILAEVELTYAFQDGRWALKDSKTVSPPYCEISGSWSE